MTQKTIKKLEPPLNMTKELFINKESSNIAPEKLKQKGRAQTVTFTLNNLDIDVLEKQVDRAIFLNKRNKSKSAIIRMALRALDNTSDAEYSNLYNEF